MLVPQILLYYLLNAKRHVQPGRFSFNISEDTVLEKPNRIAQHTWNIDVSCEKFFRKCHVF